MFDYKKLATVLAISPLILPVIIVLFLMAPLMFAVGFVSEDGDLDDAIDGTKDICFGWTRILTKDYYTNAKINLRR